MDRERAAVLDLGGSKVVCLAATLTDEGRIQAEAFASVSTRAFNKGRVLEEDDLARAVMAVVQKVEKELGGSLNSLYVNLGGKELQSSTSQGYLPLVPASRAIRYEDVLTVLNHSRQILLPSGREMVASMPREFHVDGQRGIASPIGLGGSKLEVVTTLVTGSIGQMEAIHEVVLRAGKSITNFIVQPMASAVGVASSEQLDGGCAVIDLGASLMNMAVYANHVPVHLASLPLGADLITSDISILLKADIDEAERVKLDHGSCLPNDISDGDIMQIRQVSSSQPRALKRKALAEVIEARARELAHFASRELEKSGMRGRLTGGILLTGGGANLEGIETIFGQAMGGAKVRVTVPKTTGANSRRLMEPQFATAVGLAKHVLDGDQQEFEPVSATKSWKENIRTLQSFFGRRS
jgi:cell division protein FtsA